MRFSALEKYGLRCLVQIGQSQEHTGAGLTLSDISKAEGLSVANVAKIMRLLRLGGFVESARGSAGGYRLARPSDQIMINDILVALDGHLLDLEGCEANGETEALSPHPPVRAICALWGSIALAIDRMLGRISLRDLYATEQEADVRFRPMGNEASHAADMA